MMNSLLLSSEQREEARRECPERNRVVIPGTEGVKMKKPPWRRGDFFIKRSYNGSF